MHLIHGSVYSHGPLLQPALLFLCCVSKPEFIPVGFLKIAVLYFCLFILCVSFVDVLIFQSGYQIGFLVRVDSGSFLIHFLKCSSEICVFL